MHVSLMLRIGGASYCFYAVDQYRAYFVQFSAADDGEQEAALAELVKEVRWLFGDLRLILLSLDDSWHEIDYDPDGSVTSIIPYKDEIPVEEETGHE